MTSVSRHFVERFLIRGAFRPAKASLSTAILLGLCILAFGYPGLVASTEGPAAPVDPRPVASANPSSDPGRASPLTAVPGRPAGESDSASGAHNQNDGPTTPGSVLAVRTDYTTAYLAAKNGQKLLIVLFASPEQREASVGFLADGVGVYAGGCEVVVVFPDATIKTHEGEVRLWEHPSFSELQRKPGVALVSFLGGPDDPDYGKVVATIPAGENGAMGPPERQRIVDLLDSLFVSSRTRSDRSGPGRPLDVPRQDTAAQNGEVTLATHLAPILEPEVWLTSYEAGVAQARREKKMLLVYLYPEADGQLRNQFESRALRDPLVIKELTRFVRVRLPESATVDEQGKSVRLLSHPMLSEMEGQPGLFIVDYASEGEKYYGQVVSQFPFLDGKPYTAQQMLAILTLPPGTLTQRTMVYAVRVHPERPRSVLGRPDPYLFAEAEKHSEYQARIRLQGHHFWETRFGRIISVLRGQRTASEVCAESWPGQGLLRAALECVRCWRLSPGHWRAVASEHDGYGYDIKRGSNGVWYATGIFVNR